MSRLLVLSIIVIFLTACSPTPTAVPTALPTATQQPTVTPVPINTPTPTLEPWMQSLPENVISVEKDGDQIFGLDAEKRRILQFDFGDGEWVEEERAPLIVGFNSETNAAIAKLAEAHESAGVEMIPLRVEDGTPEGAPLESGILPTETEGILNIAAEYVGMVNLGDVAALADGWEGKRFVFKVEREDGVGVYFAVQLHRSLSNTSEERTVLFIKDKVSSGDFLDTEKEILRMRWNDVYDDYVGRFSVMPPGRQVVVSLYPDSGDDAHINAAMELRAALEGENVDGLVEVGDGYLDLAAFWFPK